MMLSFTGFSLSPAAEAASSGRSPLAWIFAGLFALGALYLFIRLLELDHANRETPNQEDPLLAEGHGRHGDASAGNPPPQGKT